MSKFLFENNSDFITLSIILKYNKKKHFNFLTKNMTNKQNKIDVIEYIQQYKFLFNEPLQNKETIAGFENTIWTCWLQGKENAPLIIKKAMDTVEKYNTNKIIVITENNLSQYIQIPDFILDKYDCGIISKTHLSDYIRASLLSKYGGTWIDASCYFTAKIPNEILNSEFFQFKTPSWYLFDNIPSLKLYNSIKNTIPNITNYHTGSSWFLHAKRNNCIINRILQLLNEYWKKENYLVDYFLFHNFLTFAILNDEECKKVFNNMISMHNMYPHLLQNTYSEPFNLDLWNEITNKSFVHKLNWKGIKNSSEDNFLNYILKI